MTEALRKIQIQAGAIVFTEDSLGMCVPKSGLDKDLIPADSSLGLLFQAWSFLTWDEMADVRQTVAERIAVQVELKDH